MTKTAQKFGAPRPQATFNSDYTDNALLHLERAQGLLYLLQNTLDPTAANIPDNQLIGLMATVQSLTGWAYDNLTIDRQQHGHDWTNVLLWLDGVRGGLSALTHGYLNQCERPNNHTQMALVDGLCTVTGEAMADISILQAKRTLSGSNRA